MCLWGGNMGNVIRASINIGAIIGSPVPPALSADPTTFFAVLSGGNEVSSTGQANAGDQDAFGTATVVLKSATAVCVSITVVNLATPTLAHIREQKAGVNGPIVLQLTPPSAGNPGISSECVSVAKDLGNRTRKNPEQFYVNVHTGEFPGGAIRGQLF
jgi:hypothetical protein